MDREKLEAKKKELENLKQRVEITYQQVIGQLTLLDELLKEFDKKPEGQS